MRADNSAHAKTLFGLNVFDKFVDIRMMACN